MDAFMSDDDRDRLRDALADWVGGRLGAARAERVRTAVEEDPDLRAEARLLRTIAAGRVEAPEGLDVRITAAVLRDRRGSPAPADVRRKRAGGWPGFRAPAWAVAAAAVLVLAVGTVELVDRAGREEARETEALVAALESPHTPWVADDGTVAGAAVLDGLSEEALASLLEELGG